MSIAIVGAGPSGLVAARILQAAGESVTVFDKGRGIGGRMATRRNAHGTFDHGAPGFTLSDDSWGATVSSWHRAGVCAPLWIDGQRYWTGVGGMSAIGRWLGKGLDVRSSVTVARVEADGGLWDDQDGLLGHFDTVVVTAPAPQAVAIAGNAAPDCVSALQAVSYAPCWTLMVALHTAPRAIGGIRTPLALATREAAKPGRGALGECWVAHANAGWSLEHVSDSTEDVVETLSETLCASLGIARSNVAHASAHRWLYAQVTQPLGDSGVLASQQAPLLFAGDYTLGDGVECAFRSGEAVAVAVLAGAAGPIQGDRAMPK